jgi:hypothetical protein
MLILSVSPRVRVTYWVSTGKLGVEIVVISVQLETPFLGRTTVTVVARSGSTPRNHRGRDVNSLQ